MQKDTERAKPPTGSFYQKKILDLIYIAFKW